MLKLNLKYVLKYIEKEEREEVEKMILILSSTKGGPNWAQNTVDAPIIVDEDVGEYYKQPMYYALGHVTRF